MKKNTRTQKRRIHVVIVETDPLRLAGFRALLESYDDLHLESLALPAIGADSKIDVLLLGKRPNLPLSQTLQQLKAARPGVRIIVTASTRTDETVLEALANGAKGYVDESAPADEFVNAIRIVDQGLIWASRRVLASFVDRTSAADKRILGRTEFTRREQEVLEMLATGRSNREIADPLGIEVRTVKAHVAKLMRKVGVQNRIALSVHAINNSLVAPR
jgi:DNA-binding NarL/FixJ family response regulator